MADTLRVRRKVWVNSFRDTALKDGVYRPDEVERLVQSDAFDQWGGHSFDIAAAGNLDLSFVGVDNALGIYLEVNVSNVEVTINGSDTPIIMSLPTTGEPACLFLEAAITSINVKAPAGSAVDGHFHIWGKETV